jgi:Alpha-(1,6)-fucosyltransferase N- and catalytic domains
MKMALTGRLRQRTATARTTSRPTTCTCSTWWNTCTCTSAIMAAITLCFAYAYTATHGSTLRIDNHGSNGRVGVTEQAAVLGWNHAKTRTWNDRETSTNADTGTMDTREALLQHQVRASNEFQALIHRNQHSSSSSSSSSIPCRERRVLMLPPSTLPYDGFTLELHAIGRFLQIAVTTDRTLVLRNNFTSGYAPPNCAWRTDAEHTATQVKTTTTKNTTTSPDRTQGGSSSWNCLYQPISDCTETMILNTTLKYVPSTHKAARGIDDHDWSNTLHFGDTRIVTGADWTNKGIHLDHVAHYERLFGRFWVRSQIQQYLWKPSTGLLAEIHARLPHTLHNVDYIGIHVRFTDNIGSFRSDFGRDAVLTRKLDAFMDIAQDIRTKTGISTIYLATDSNKVLDNLNNSSSFSDWTFIVQANVPRTSGDEWFWFQNSRAYSAAAIATDLQVLRNADYLIGSFQSNVYRLAAELNTAAHMHKYPLYQNRHFSVDVEWYEDP